MRLNTSFVTLAAVLGAVCVCANARPLGDGDMHSDTANARRQGRDWDQIPTNGITLPGPYLTLTKPLDILPTWVDIAPTEMTMPGPAQLTVSEPLVKTQSQTAALTTPSASLPSASIPSVSTPSSNPSVTTGLPVALPSPPALIIYYSTDSTEGGQPTAASKSESQAVPTPADSSITALPTITTHVGLVSTGAGASPTTSADEPEPTSSDDEYPDEGRDDEAEQPVDSPKDGREDSGEQ
ncbi:hypothetical protein C8Q80DRAFT_1125310 [Daedaleopsis nitida]|nr:hypothetical protein C8Q80DRAFT_1125310 [Daedaleopsis nitida]